MQKIVIDARESGTSTGRYIDKLIEYLHPLNPPYEIIILTKPHRVEFVRQTAPTFQVLESTYEEFTFEEQLGFKKQLESLSPDLVHFGMVQQPVLYRGSVVTTMHDLTTIRFRNPSKNAIVFTVKQRVYKWVNKAAARKSRRVIAISEFVKNDVVELTKIDPSKVVVTYEAADQIKDVPSPVGDLTGKQFIMYVGRPLPHKNLDRLIEAFQLLQQTHPDLHLVLAGKKDSLYENYERDAQTKGIKNIIFTDFVSEGQLRWLYENTAAYVVPSLSEGFGLPGLEAMANGAPVASSNLTCLPEIYGDGAVYFDPTSSEAIATSVKRLLEDAPYAGKLRQAGKDQAARYSWDRMARQTLDVYTAVLNEK